jgi:DNA-binding XRE family transcriptional regulator
VGLWKRLYVTYSPWTYSRQDKYNSLIMKSDYKNIKSAFGERLRSLRLSKDLSQEKLAELADLDRTYISSVELGKRNISIVNICRLASALQIEIKVLFDDL